MDTEYDDKFFENPEFEEEWDIYDIFSDGQYQ